MPFSATETNMADFPFHQNHDDSPTAVSNVPTCRSLFDIDSSQVVPYPTPSSNMPLPYLSSSLPAGYEMNSYFPMPYADTGWTYPEELSSEPSVIESKPSHIDTSNSMQPQYIDDFCNPSLDSADSTDSSNWDMNSAKITEYEIWNLPSSTELTNYGGMSPSIPPSSHRHSLTPITTESKNFPNAIATRANSKSDKSSSRFQSSSSSDGQSPSKRRHSSIGRQGMPLATQKTDPEAELHNVNREPEARPLAKTSHSIVERRYRENLNTKITQLDETLSGIRHPDGQPGDSKIDEHPNKTSKAEVLTEAMRYVKQAELESEARIKEIEFLRLRVAALEKLVNCGDCNLLKQFSDGQGNQAASF